MPIKKTAQSIYRYLLISFGFVFVALGVIGIFLPLLPTTPFLLLAAICFSKGSERIHNWLLSHPSLGVPIKDWKQSGVIRKKYKLMATAMLSISALYIFPKQSIPVFGKIGFALTASSVLLFIWTRPSHPKKASESFNHKETN